MAPHATQHNGVGRHLQGHRRGKDGIIGEHDHPARAPVVFGDPAVHTEEERRVTSPRPVVHDTEVHSEGGCTRGVDTATSTLGTEAEVRVGAAEEVGAVVLYVIGHDSGITMYFCGWISG